MASSLECIIRRVNEEGDNWLNKALHRRGLFGKDKLVELPLFLDFSSFLPTPNGITTLNSNKLHPSTC